jgi:hypothetical protein
VDFDEEDVAIDKSHSIIQYAQQLAYSEARNLVQLDRLQRSILGKTRRQEVGAITITVIIILL